MEYDPAEEICYLRAKCSLLDDRVKELRQKIESPSGINYDKLNVQSSPVNKFEESMAELLDLLTERNKQEVAIQHRIDDVLQHCENTFDTEGMIILKYRISGDTPMSFTRIGHKMYLEKSVVFKKYQENVRRAYVDNTTVQ